ncbi:alpha/beta fold hydrolase [Chloroflexia bacterium SDU3-3]|nr:alpha/beta fold hydrolase [Chloroflexia bacterium SDU3-3]
MPETTINGRALHYREAGAGEALLLIHALPMGSAMWEAQIEALAPYVRVIAPDLPGFGKSARAEGIDMAGYADTMVGLLDQLGVEKAAVCGLSLGGYVALAMLRAHPQRLRTLIFANSRVPADSEEAKAKRAENIALTLADGPDALADRMLPTLLSPAAPDALKAHVRSIIATNPREGLADAIRAIAGRPDSSDLLADIQVPTLLIGGEHDTIATEAELQELSTHIAESHVAVLPGAGHLSNMEQPEAFSTVLQWFLHV